MFNSSISNTINFVHARNVILFCIIIFFTACGGGTGNISSHSPATPSRDTGNTSQNTDGNTTVASAAPTAQPTQPLVPTDSIWVKGRLFISGSDINTDCETLFKNIPTIQVWEKSSGQEWKLDHELSKPDPNLDNPETMIAYQCGKFSAHFGFWGPRDNPCLNDDQIKFVASYRESNQKLYQGESPVYSCKDKENPPFLLIILEQITQPMMLAPNSSNFLMN